VKNCNEGNIGVMCLGNFELQSPSARQLETLENLLACLRDRYRISRSCVRTHREWPGAKTACPGRNLQREMVDIRARLA
jgi:N-acetyl-anhydromuramyl-L-alanine amidase AmpD